MTAENGHAASRSYMAQDGSFHLNGAAFYNDAEADISTSLEVLNDLAPAELNFLDGVTAGTVTASKALVVDATKDLATIHDLTINGNVSLTGATTANILTLTTNLADAWSIVDSAADIMVFDTTTGTPAITITPIVTITGALTLTGALIGNATTDSSSGTTGAIQTDGGIGCAKSIFVGTSVLAGGTTLGTFVPLAAQQALSGAGEANITTYYTALTNTGTDAITLPDGAVIGQLKKIQMIVDPGTDSTLTPANFAGGTTITFADVGDYVILGWQTGGWIALELGNAVDGATAPVVA